MKKLTAAARALRSRLLPTLLLPLLMLLLGSCERRPLEVLVDEAVNVQLILDWSVNFAEIYNYKPNGMTVMVWGTDGTPPKISSVNGNRLTLHLKPDAYKLIIFNDTPQEFPYQSFFDYYNYANIAMRADHFTTKSWDSGVDYMYYPDPVGVTISSFLITEDMVGSNAKIFVYYDDYMQNGDAYYSESTRTYEIHEIAWPMTVNLHVKAKVKRRQSISTIEASISGMADGFYLSRINRTSENGILRLIDDNTHRWTLTTCGAEQDSTGYIQFSIPSFGLPYGKELLAQRDSADNVLSFYITLTDGNAVQCSYNVGKDIRYITPEGREAEIRYRQDLQNLRVEIDLSELIELPPTQAKEQNGFDARVDKWDEEIVDMGGF